MKKRRSILPIVIKLTLVICTSMLILLRETHLLQRLYDNYILDNENHYLSCEELPMAINVESILKLHQNDIHEIEAVNPGKCGD